MTPTLDPSILERLQEEMAGTDIDLVAEMIGMFLADTPQMISGVKHAAVSGDVEGLRRQAHNLKGSGVNLGAARLGELCHDLETRARAQDLEGCRELIPQVERELQQASDALRALR